MIKINLLPAHILERRRLRPVIALVIAVLIIEAAILMLWMNQTKAKLADQRVELKYWTKQAAQVAQIDAATSKIKGDTDFYVRWKVWTDSIGSYHQAWADTLAEMARWIYAKVQINALTPSQTAVAIAGATDSLGSFRKAYLNLLRSPLYSGVSFTISGVTGGWAPPAATTPTAPAPSGSVAAPGAAQARNPLPVGVSFTCALKPEYSSKLVAPGPPIGGVTGGGVGAMAPAAPGGLR